MREKERERCAWTSIEMASNGIIKSLTNVEGVGFGSERRATLQFYFDRRISFVKHAVQRITIIISPPYVFEEEGGGGAYVHTLPHIPLFRRQRRQNSIFANYSSTSWLRESTLPSFLLFPPSRGNMINHPSLSLFLSSVSPQHMSFLLPFSSFLENN